MSTARRWIHESQQDLIASLEEKYAHLRLRFDTGFAGSAPVQANGKIGRRYFYFRFRHDTASLTVGSPRHRRAAGLAKRASRKARRKLRRGIEDSFDRFITEGQLRDRGTLKCHPTHELLYATIWPVTGNVYAGSLEDGEAAGLFVRLLESLGPVTPNPGRHKSFRQIMRGSWTRPMAEGHGVIRKPSAAPAGPRRRA